jgi:hypothetical protein
LPRPLEPAVGFVSPNPHCRLRGFVWPKTQPAVSVASRLPVRAKMSSNARPRKKPTPMSRLKLMAEGAAVTVACQCV